MSTSGWSITYPQLIAFGARALSVPGRGNVLCASAVVPFRLSDGEIVAAAQWYSAVRAHAGDGAIPDAVAPLPGAELLVLGPVGPLSREPRDCIVRCGAVNRRLLLAADADDEGPLFLGPDAALWHERDNPVGRGGPGDMRPPLVRDKDEPGRPVWLGPTGLDHPARQRHAGNPGDDSVGGWPGDASAASLHDAHEAFWADGLFAGDPLRLGGVGDEHIDVDLPPYRVSLAVCRGVEGVWTLLDSRIHVVAVVPMAGIGAMIWRGAVDLGGDVMGEDIAAVVAALDDADAPERDPDDLAEVVLLRWEEPAHATDDRPLLPPSLHHLVDLPFDALPEGGDPRQAAAQAWALSEMGLDRNPYENVATDGDALAAKAVDAVQQNPMDAAAMGEVADAVAEHAKERHRAMGFGDVAPPEVQPAVPRGDALDDEVSRRLALPYQTPHELAIVANLERVPQGAPDVGETLDRLAQARVESPDAPLFWPPLPLGEAVRFGEALLGRLGDGDLPRHADVSGAQVGDAPAVDPRLAPPPNEEDSYVWYGPRPPALDTPGTLARLERRHSVRDRRLDGLLAEETGWRGIVFENCEFMDSSFANGYFENCEFVRCTWEGSNVTAVTFVDCRFESCSLVRLTADDPVFMACEFNDCHLEKMSLHDVAARDLTFNGGTWASVDWQEGMLVNLSVAGTELAETTFAMVRAVHIVFEDVSMRQVSALGRGFPYATFRNVNMHRCGFVGFHFDNSRWELVRAEESGMTNCVFAEAVVARDCEFRRCDFTGAAFTGADIGGARFVECTMTFTGWSGAAAEDAWFFGSNLRGVHFSDARLARAVFCDADIRDAVFREEETIGADFSGTCRAGVA